MYQKHRYFYKNEKDKNEKHVDNYQEEGDK